MATAAAAASASAIDHPARRGAVASFAVATGAVDALTGAGPKPAATAIGGAMRVIGVGDGSRANSASLASVQPRRSEAASAGSSSARVACAISSACGRRADAAGSVASCTSSSRRTKLRAAPRRGRSQPASSGARRSGR